MEQNKVTLIRPCCLHGFLQSDMLGLFPVIQSIISLFCCSVGKSYPTLCDPMDSSMKASLSFTVFQNLLRFRYIESVIWQAWLTWLFYGCLSFEFQKKTFCLHKGRKVA